MSEKLRDKKVRMRFSPSKAEWGFKLTKVSRYQQPPIYLNIHALLVLGLGLVTASTLATPTVASSTVQPELPLLCSVLLLHTTFTILNDNLLRLQALSSHPLKDPYPFPPHPYSSPYHQQTAPLPLTASIASLPHAHVMNVDLNTSGICMV